MKWQLVPEKPTPEMVDAGVKAFQQNYNSEDVCEDWRCCYKAMLAASPQPEHDRMTKEEAQAMQDWKGMDGAIAFHLIERHVDGWHQVGKMMDAWLEANRVPNVQIEGQAASGQSLSNVRLGLFSHNTEVNDEIRT